LTIQQLKRNVEELKASIHPKHEFQQNIPLTPEVVRCCHEFIRAQSDARQRLINSGISEIELKKHEYDNFLDDHSVMRAYHNKLIAISNTRIHDREPEKIDYLYDSEPWRDNISIC
jgi:hypothetical protein